MIVTAMCVFREKRKQEENITELITSIYTRTSPPIPHSHDAICFSEYREGPLQHYHSFR